MSGHVRSALSAEDKFIPCPSAYPLKAVSLTGPSFGRLIAKSGHCAANKLSSYIGHDVGGGALNRFISSRRDGVPLASVSKLNTDILECEQLFPHRVGYGNALPNVVIE